MTQFGPDSDFLFDAFRRSALGTCVVALARSFPVTRELVGGETFQALATEYFGKNPPASGELALYGDGFAHFISHTPVGALRTYLPDLARLEYIRVLSANAEDAKPIHDSEFRRALYSPEALKQARLVLLPSVYVVQSIHAVVSLWVAYNTGAKVSEVNTNRGEHAVVVRRENHTVLMRVSAAMGHFVEALRLGATCGMAAGQSLVIDSWFDLDIALSLLLKHGLVAQVDAP